MRCLIDTNILVSAALFPKSVSYHAFYKAVSTLRPAMVCDYSLDELFRVFNTKFPHRLEDYERFLSTIEQSVEIVPTPSEAAAVEAESKIRDIKDRPILRAAIASEADILITGDKDFLESGVTKPRIMSAAEFLDAR